MTAAVELIGVRKRYRQGWLRRQEIEAVGGVDLVVERGELFGLLGPNGAGKTTLTKMILGIVRPDSGSIHLLGGQSPRIAKRRIGYLPEHFTVPRHLTAAAAMRLLAKLSRLPPANIAARVDRCLEQVGLASRRDDPVRTFSKGMKQRLGLAQALLAEPELIFLDEPTDGLDPVGRHDIRLALQQLRDAGTTVVVNSHILREIEVFCDRLAVMNRGRVIASGGVDAIIAAAGQSTVASLIFESHREMVAIADDMHSFNVKVEAVSDRSDRFLVRLSELDMVETNRLVDRLRVAGDLIVELSPGGRDLESAFLHLIAQD